MKKTITVNGMIGELVDEFSIWEDTMLNAFSNLREEFLNNSAKIYLISVFSVIAGSLLMGIVGCIFGMPIFCIPAIALYAGSVILSFFTNSNEIDEIIFEK